MKDRIGWFFVGFCAGALFSVLGTEDLGGDAWVQAVGAGIVLGLLSGWLVPQVMARPDRRHARKRAG